MNESCIVLSGRTNVVAALEMYVGEQVEVGAARVALE